MTVDAQRTFLVSGQRLQTVDGFKQVTADIEHCIVVADSAVDVYKLLATQKPNFMPLGHASLEQHEDAAFKIRSALKGEPSNWSVLFADGFEMA